ncbi:MAG: hypothetical protein U0936_22070 [Planctomycetaceae bacterium]
MQTFVFRDRRRARIEQALEVLLAQIATVQSQRDGLLASRNALAADPNHDPGTLAALELQLADSTRQLQEREIWQSQLLFEQSVLAGSGWQVDDLTHEKLAIDWIWQTSFSHIPGVPPFDDIGIIGAQIAADLNARIALDAVQLVLNASFVVSLAFCESLAVLIQELRNSGVRVPPEDLLERIRNIAAADVTLVDELISTAHRHWVLLQDRSSPFDHVCTLLPVRIETIFPKDDPGRIWIRVTPDETSISRHRTLVKQTERNFLQEFWSELRKHIPDPGLPPAEWLVGSVGSVAFNEWSILCSRVTPQRAAWLVTQFLPTMVNGLPVIEIPTVADESEEAKNESDMILAWPEKVEVWILDSNVALKQIGTLEPVDPETDVLLPPNTPRNLRLPLPGRTNTERLFDHWSTNFKEAQKAGLGRKLPLPAGVTKESIQALFVIGVSEEPPAELFHAHAASGTMGLLRLGMPTNTVHGQPAADLAKDPAAWFDVVRQRLELQINTSMTIRKRTAFKRMSHALAGNGISLPICPVSSGPEYDPVVDFEDSQRFVHALWPVLWGHFFRDHLGMFPGNPDRTGPTAYDYWQWCAEHLFPEGPLPPVRIHDQPYGILPVTTLEDWSGEEVGNPQWTKLEADLVARLKSLRLMFAGNNGRPATSQPPAIVGADLDGVLAVLSRDASTRKYAYRKWMRFEEYVDRLPNPRVLQAPESAWKQTHHVPFNDIIPESGTRAFAGTPHLAAGWPQYLDLSLIAAQRLPRLMRENDLVERFTIGDMVEWVWAMKNFDSSRGAPLPWDRFSRSLMNGMLPDSLCIRLMIESLMLAQAWVGQELTSAPSRLLNPKHWTGTESVLQKNRNRFLVGVPTPEPVLAEQTELTFKTLSELGRELDQWLVEYQDPFPEADGQDQRIQRLEIPPDRLAQLERAFRATLDTASHRIDPWMTGLAWRRLNLNSGSSRGKYTAGVYGWVDGPFQGELGPNDAGLLHAPSQQQAITSIVLRDKYLSGGRSNAVAGGKNIWQMHVESDLARKALEISEECRLGFHLFEVVGRQLECIVDDFPKIRALRRFSPQHPDAPDPLVVCHGIEALKAVLSEVPLAPQPGLPAGELSAEQVRLSLAPDRDPEKRRQIELLQASLDVYADLLIADAVHHVVTGLPQRAADAMDAGAGFGQSPALDSIRTPASGYRIQTIVMSVFPAVQAPALPEAADLHPCHLAEPSLAAYIQSVFPDTTNYRWTIQRKGIANEILAEPSLTELGWTIAEASVLPEQMLAGIFAAVSLPESDATARLDDLVIVAPRQYFAAREMWQANGSRPINPQVLRSLDVPSAAEAEITSGILRNLELRIVGLGASLQALNDNIQRVDQLEPSKIFLRRAISWGIAPLLESTKERAMYRFVFGNRPETTVLEASEWTAAAARSVATRYEKLPRHENQEPIIPEGLSARAKLIAEVACADGKLSILSVWSNAAIKQFSEIQPDTPTGQPEEDWLTQVAAVRAPMARIESLQLQSLVRAEFKKLELRTNVPGDPWHSKYVRENSDSEDMNRRRGQSAPRLVAAFGKDGAWNSPQIAVGLIDDFGESIPLAKRQTYASFGFNAPASRPQQAILLAVPPQARTQLTHQVLLQTLLETRELTRARAVRPEDLRNGHGLVSNMWFAGAGPDRVRLDTDTQFWSLE